jgi:hypothetical protein
LFSELSEQPFSRNEAGFRAIADAHNIRDGTPEKNFPKKRALGTG